MITQVFYNFFIKIIINFDKKLIDAFDDLLDLFISLNFPNS